MSFQFMLFPNFKKLAFTLSYDDATRDDIRLVEIMQKHGLKGTFNLNSGTLNNENRIRKDEVFDLYIKTGNEVAVHGVKHHHLTDLTDQMIIEEVFEDRKELERLTGRIVNGMAYAFGDYDDRVISVLKKCGILYSRTVKSTHNFNMNDNWLEMPATCHHDDERLFELLDEFLKDDVQYAWQKRPKLFYLWGHSYEFARNNNWERIEKIGEKIGRRDDVWYATNGEIVNYVEAYKSLVYSADGKIISNPSALDVYIRTLDDKQVLIKAGESVSL